MSDLAHLESKDVLVKEVSVIVTDCGDEAGHREDSPDHVCDVDVGAVDFALDDDVKAHTRAGTLPVGSRQKRITGSGDRYSTALRRVFDLDGHASGEAQEAPVLHEQICVRAKVAAAMQDAAEEAAATVLDGLVHARVAVRALRIAAR